MVIATKPARPNPVIEAASKFLGRGGENVILPALGFIAVLFLWSIVAWATSQNKYPSELPSVSKTVSDSVPYIQNFFSTKKGDEGVLVLTALSLGRVAVGFVLPR